jgi:phage terminase large subunit-like protein
LRRRLTGRSPIPAIRVARHLSNAVVKEDARGTRLAKTPKHSTRRIDLAVAAVMAHARACELDTTAEPMIYLL